MTSQGTVLSLCILAALATAAEARAACDLAELCPDLSATAMCAAEATCSDAYSDCVSGCVPDGGASCLDACKSGFTTCGTRHYAAGAACFPCAFDPSLCPQKCSALPSHSGIDEHWGAAALGSYTPLGGANDTFITGDAGQWAVEDTVSSFPDCGATQNRATVFAEGSGKSMRLNAVFSDSDCTDNVWTELQPNAPGHNAYQVPFAAGMAISFRESGAVDDPQDGVVRLWVGDDRGRRLAYVLQRPQGYTANDSDLEHEVLLDPGAEAYQRDLFADFAAIPAFSAHMCRRITSVLFEIDAPGNATLSDLVIAAAPEPRLALGSAVAVATLLSLASRAGSGSRV